jgi:3-polyprenyl-4-hydroxybenzoate decarboxylase
VCVCGIFKFMRITPAQLRQIIKEEVKKTKSLKDLKSPLGISSDKTWREMNQDKDSDRGQQRPTKSYYYSDKDLYEAVKSGSVSFEEFVEVLNYKCS